LRVVFTDTARALLWDSNCDNLYHVDIAASRQVTAGTIRMGGGGPDAFSDPDLSVRALVVA